jgi:hypothetical protein
MLRRRRWIFVRNAGIAAAVMVVAGATTLIWVGHSGSTPARARAAVTALKPSVIPQAAPGPSAGPSPVPSPVPPPGTRPGFGLVEPGATSTGLLFAAAKRSRQGGPETLRAVDVAPYHPVRLAPGAQLWITVPIYQGSLPDVVKGVQVPPDRFTTLYRAEDSRFGPILDRAHMFDVRFDAKGRIAWIHQIFSP